MTEEGTCEDCNLAHVPVQLVWRGTDDDGHARWRCCDCAGDRWRIEVGEVDFGMCSVCRGRQVGAYHQHACE